MEYNKNILLNSFEIHKATWKPDDLHKVCAILNTQDGSMTFGTRIKPLDKLRHLIEKKVEKNRAFNGKFDYFIEHHR